MLALEKVSFMRETFFFFFALVLCWGGYIAGISRTSSDSMLQGYSCLLIVIESVQKIRVHQIFKSVVEDFQDSEEVKRETHSPVLSRMRTLLSKHCAGRWSASLEGGICGEKRE